MQQCPADTSNMTTTIVAVGVLLVSEVLPFLKTIKGNGVVDAIVQIFSHVVPPQQEPTPSRAEMGRLF
jgi:hypothetical protein